MVMQSRGQIILELLKGITSKVKFSQRIHNNRAMLCMFLGMFFFSIADAQSKFLTGSLPAIQIAWARQLVLFSCVFVFIVLRGIKVLETKHPCLQISRGAHVTTILKTNHFNIFYNIDSNFVDT